MGTTIKEERHFYFIHQSAHEEGKGEFEFQLTQPLILTGTQRIIIRQAVLPKIKVKFPASAVTLDDRVSLTLPSFYLSSPSEVVEKINELSNRLLLEFFPSEIYDSKAVITVNLYPGQSLSVSPIIANLLFEKRNAIANNTGRLKIYRFSSQKEYEENTYLLTCNLAEKTRVGTLEVPLINTLVVQYREGASQTHLLWTTEETQGRSYTKTGVFRSIKIGICDRDGEVVKLKGGIFFIHLKVCT